MSRALYVQSFKSVGFFKGVGASPSGVGKILKG